MAQSGCLKSTKTEIQSAGAYFRNRKLEPVRVTLWSQAIDDRTSGIPQAKKLGQFVQRFSGSIVPSPSN